MAKKIHAKLYIEGCEIPFINITITGQINHPSVCMIDLVPSEFVKKLSPRSHMLVLFQEDATWKVLWDGEFRGWGMAKSAGSVMMQINGADHSNALSFMTRSVFENFDNMEIPIKAIFHTGQEFNIQPAGGATFAGIVGQAFNRVQNADFGTLLTSLMGNLWANVPYFSEANTRNRTVERFVSLVDTNLGKILTNQIALDFMTNIIRNRFANSNVTIESVLQYFMEVAGYIRCPVIAPSSFNGIPELCIFKPKNYFSTPPACNTYFPGMYTTLSGLGVDYFTEPTRILMMTENIPAPGGYRSAYFFNDSRTGLNLNSQITNAALIKGAISPEEADKGILPLQLDLNFEKANQATIGASDTNFKTLQATYQAYAYYQFVENKFSLRHCSTSGIFHPYAVVGFPGVIFDPHQTLFGMVESITHTLSAEGNASTITNFSHVYPADRFDPSGITHPPLPSWLSINYRPEGANATYQALFGNNIIDDKVKHAALGGPNISNSKREIQSYALANDEQYDIADIASSIYPIDGPVKNNQTLPMYLQNKSSPTDFELKYAYRRIISAKEYFQFMNIKLSLDSDTQEPPSTLPPGSLLFKNPTSYSLNADRSYDTPQGSDLRKYNNALALQQDLNASVGKDGR